MSRLQPVEFRRLLQQETDRLAAIGADDLTLTVPHLPGWSVHSVVGHVAWIFRWVSQCLEASPDNPPARSAVGEPPVGAEVLEWYREAADLVTETLDTCDLDEVRPSWAGPQNGRWWLRRLSHEVAMHRWDVDSADANTNPINAALARDGIDEVLEVFVPARFRFDTFGSGNGAASSTIHLHATDIDEGEWLLHLGPDSLRWERSHAKADVAARGTASDLLLTLWSRITPDRLEAFGDADLLDRWQQAATF
jgi:uncharacterized protein (TIGR03083 family)